MKKISDLVVIVKIEEFRISLRNRYSTSTDEDVLSVQAMNDNVTGIVTTCATGIGDKAVRQDTGKLFCEKTDLIRKIPGIKASTEAGRLELSGLKINKRKVAGLSKYKYNVREVGIRRKSKSGANETEAKKLRNIR